MEAKIQIRENCIKLREKLGKNYIEKQSGIIVEKFLSSTFYTDSKVFFVYLSMPYEVNTKYLIRAALKENKTILVPTILNHYKMMPTIIHANSTFMKNKYGIDESEIKNYYNDFIDVIITPGLAFDAKGNRIGYGGGYYDRFFLQNQYETKIAFCLEEFIFKKIPVNNFDIKMDAIFTQNKIFNFN